MKDVTYLTKDGTKAKGSVQVVRKGDDVGFKLLNKAAGKIDDVILNTLKSHSKIKKLGLSTAQLDDFSKLLNGKMSDKASDIFKGLKSHLDAATSFQGLSKTINDLNKYGHFADGSKWILEYLSSSKGLSKFGGKKLMFELSSKVDGAGMRFIDIADVTNNAKWILFEFKSVKTAFTKSYARQFTKDLLNNSVKELSQVKWFYNGAKNPVLDKHVLIKLLKKNSNFNSNKKVVELFDNFRIKKAVSGKVRDIDDVFLFLEKNDDWFNEIFKKVDL